MPTLDRIGRTAAVNRHRDVPDRPIRCDRAKPVGDPDAGKVKCIHIEGL